MPKSKRARHSALTAVKPKGRSSKEKLIESIRESLNTFEFLFVFRVENMRNQSMKEVRELWKGSRFFMGKTSVMRRALEGSGEEKHKESLQQLCQHFHGEVGLLFTDSDVKKVMEWFSSYRVPNYAKAGFVTSREFKLAAGPLPSDVAPFSVEPQLRKLGLPTRLQNGIVELSMPVTVCQSGDSLTPEQCRILQIFEEKMAEFTMKIIGVWHGEKGFQSFESASEKEKHKASDSKRSKAKKMEEDEEDNAEGGMDLDESKENKLNSQTDSAIDEVFSSSSSLSSSAAPAPTPRRSTRRAAAATPYQTVMAAKKSAASAKSKSKSKRGKKLADDEDMDE